MIIMKIGYGLGNQMFQYAFASSLAKKKKDKLLIPKSFYDSEDRLREFGLDKFELKNHIDYLENHKIIYKLFCWHEYGSKNRIVNKMLRMLKKLHIFFDYNERYDGTFRSFKEDIPYKKHRINVYTGIFQCERYFFEDKETLKKAFNVCNARKKIVSFSEGIDKNKAVCVHIRRGDYVDNPLFYVCNLGYYRRAIEKTKTFIRDAEIYVFSDDINWVKENFEDINPIDFTENMYEDIFLMSKFRHFIISNSTFSWWGQYLSDYNGIVIAPDHWFPDKLTKNDYIFQSNWILVETD